MTRLFALALPLLLVACGTKAGEPGAAGMNGKDAPGAPAVAAVLPTKVFVTRTTTVTVSGSETSWSAGATVDFGPGITVTDTIVASPASIVCTIEIDAGAALGPRDVTVSDGGTSLSWKRAFNVSPPAGLLLHGEAAQGSLAVVRVNDLDPNNPFDNTSQVDESGYPFFPNFNVKAPIEIDSSTGVGYIVNSVGARSAELLLMVDVDAAAGAREITFESGTEEAITEFPVPAAYSVVARAPTALTPGTPATGTFAKAYDSKVFSFQPPAGLQVIDLALTATGTGAAEAGVQYYRLPANGHFEDFIEQDVSSLYTTSTAMDRGYLVVWDGIGGTDYTYTLSAKATAATPVAVKAPEPKDRASAQTIATTGPIVVQGVVLASDTTVRVFRFDIAGGNVGKKLRALTEAGPGGDSYTDVNIDLWDANGDSLLADGPLDDDYLDNFLSEPLAAGTYYIALAAGTAYEDSSTHFQVMFRLE